MALKGINKVGVAGSGTMGRGIAQVFALYGYEVVLVDKEESILKSALDRIKERTAPELWDKVASLIKTTTDFKDLGKCQIVIEAVFEDPEVKKGVFKTLSSICGDDAIIATNTSSISITGLSESVSKPERFIGMHFMHPPKVMKLVEVIKGEKTSEKTADTVVALAKDIEKVPAVVSDTPGFVSNRLLFTLISEAMRLLENGVASKEAIDTVMKYGMNHPMGPIELADFIGLDVCMEIMNYIYTHLNDEKFRPPAVLEELVSAGKLGRKTKEGFYRYD